MENQPKTLKTYKNWVVQVVTGDSQEEVMIFRDRHTCIIIYISASPFKKILVLNRWRPCAAVILKRPRAAATAQCTSSDKIRLGD